MSMNRTIVLSLLIGVLFPFSGWGRGTSVFKNSDRIPFDKGKNYACALGDIDGDGDLDIFISGECNYLYRNNGSGSYTDISVDNFPGRNDGGTDAEFCDVDGDSHLDLAILGNTNRLYLNNGQGVFTDVTFTNFSMIQPEGSDIIFGDVDNDGDQDIYITKNGTNRLYLNNGGGVFFDATSTHLPPEEDKDSYGAEFGDVDGDNDLDIVVANGPGFEDSPGINCLYLNDGNGVYANATLTNMPDNNFSSFDIKLGDVNGDGDLDIFVSNARGCNSLYLNNGAGVFTDVTSAHLPDEDGLSSTAAALGDIDGDGDLDIFIANNLIPGGQQNRLYINDGSGVFSDGTSNIPYDEAQSNAVELGDIDGDGDLDVVIANNNNRTFLYENNGTGTFRYASSVLPPTYELTTNSATADVDGDGDLDIFFVTLGQNRLYLNTGGEYIDVTSTNLPQEGDVGFIAEFGDMDNDGDLDLYIGRGHELNSVQDGLYLNDGSGIFTDVTATHLPPFVSETWDIELGDVNGDGYLDVFCTGWDTNATTPLDLITNILYLNDGEAKFNLQTSHPFYSIFSMGGDLGDIDNDGDLDLILANENRTYLFINDGSAQFSEASSNIITPQVGSSDVNLNDIDNDDDLDLTLITDPGSELRIYINEGGAFSYKDQTNAPGCMKTEFADVNDDSYPDVAIMQPGPTLLYMNTGEGSFTDASANLPGLDSNARNIIFGDVDSDGDMDLFIITPTVNWVYLNQYDPRLSNPSLLVDSGDYNGNGTSDIAIFRQNSGLWAIRGLTRFYFGSSYDLPISGDYDGNRKTEAGIFRSTSSLWAVRGITRIYFGAPTDMPAPGDYNGDRSTDVAIFRYDTGLWAVKDITRVYFGGSTDEPVSGYFNGDETKDIGIFRPSSGLWAIRNVTRLYFGSSSDTIVPGDFDGDGIWETGIFRGTSGLWAIRGVTRSYFGSGVDQPVPGDYKGDGRDDIGIYRESSGLWAISGVSRIYFGGAEDVPVTR